MGKRAYQTFAYHGLTPSVPSQSDPHVPLRRPTDKRFVLNVAVNAGKVACPCLTLGIRISPRTGGRRIFTWCRKL